MNMLINNTIVFYIIAQIIQTVGAFAFTTTSIITSVFRETTIPKVPLRNAAKVLVSSRRNRSGSLQMNFFKDLMDKAFENDPNLSSDISQEQIDGDDQPTNEGLRNSQKTLVQQRWLASQERQLTSTTISGTPIRKELLSNSQWQILLFLTGTPDFDPSNTLFGSRVNISSRKDSQMASEGFAIGADQLPQEPSATVKIRLLDNGACVAEPSQFTSGKIEGQWRLSEDCRQIRFSLYVKGYQRTVTTKGSIQNIYWSDRDDMKRRSSATYSINPGWAYAESNINYGSSPGVLVMGTKAGTIPEGVLRVEKSVGLVGKQLLSVGKFSAKMIMDDAVSYEKKESALDDNGPT